jgi:hypothetical protein
MQDAQFALSIEEAVRICVAAGACNADLKDWRDYVGSWLTELAFSDLTKEEGEILYRQLKVLRNAVPEMWLSSGRADAAPKALSMS